MSRQNASGPGSVQARVGLGRVFAIAHHTFREAIRSRILLILVLLGLIVIASSQFFPALDLEQRFKVIQSVCLGASGFFVTVLAILLAASSVPRDLEEKYAYTVLTKPVSRLVFLWGKMLGFAMVLGLLLGVMWSMTCAFTYLTFGRGRLAVSAVDPEGPAAAAGIRAGDALVSLDGHRFHDVDTADQYLRGLAPGTMVTAEIKRGGETEKRAILSQPPGAGTGGAFLEALGLDLRSVTGQGQNALLPARLLFHGSTGLQQQGTKMLMGDVGGGPNVVTAVFENVPVGALPPGDLRVSARMDITTTSVGRYGTTVKVAAYDPSADSWMRFDHYMSGKTETTLLLPRRALSQDRKVQLRMYRDDRDVFFTVQPTSFALLLKPRPMVLNLLASYGVLFGQVVLISLVASAASTFLSAYVAMLLSFSVYLMGNLTDFLRIVASKLIEGVYRIPGHYHGELDFSQYVPRWYDPIIGWATWIFTWAFPDFRKFDPLSHLLASQSIPWNWMAEALVFLLLYGGVAFIIGSVVISRREVT